MLGPSSELCSHNKRSTPLDTPSRAASAPSGEHDLRLWQRGPSERPVPRRSIGRARERSTLAPSPTPTLPPALTRSTSAGCPKRVWVSRFVHPQARSARDQRAHRCGRSPDRRGCGRLSTGAALRRCPRGRPAPVRSSLPQRLDVDLDCGGLPSGTCRSNAAAGSVATSRTRSEVGEPARCRARRSSACASAALASRPSDHRPGPRGTEIAGAALSSRPGRVILSTARPWRGDSRSASGQQSCRR